MPGFFRLREENKLNIRKSLIIFVFVISCGKVTFVRPSILYLVIFVDAVDDPVVASLIYSQLQQVASIENKVHCLEHKLSTTRVRDNERKNEELDPFDYYSIKY